MSSSPFARGTRNEPTAVVVDFDPAPNPGLPALEVYGAVDGARVQDALDGIALRDPAAAAWCPVLTAHGPEHHSLRFTSGAGAAPRDFPLGLLADLLTRPGTVGVPPTRRIASTPLQRELLADADAHPGTGRQVEQLAWDWHGPLDSERFTSAWQSVVARESVLRTAFDDGPEPATVIHDRIDAEVQRLPCTPAAWPALLESDRRRGLDPRRPGPLRITVLDTQATPAAIAPSRLLLTYHHALLDAFSVRLLLREICRAYLADGRLPGGQRRPDMGDYLRWLTGQDTAPADEFFTRSLPGDDGPVVGRELIPHAPQPAAGADGFTGDVAEPAAEAEGFTGRPTAGPGTQPLAVGLSTPAGEADVPAGEMSAVGGEAWDDCGCVRFGLTPGESGALAAWAGIWGVTESTVLQAVWALLLYRAGGEAGAAPVRFSTTVSGRGIGLEGVERLPGALSGPQPLSVRVDPRATVPALLAELRDRALDMAGYEWVSAGQIHAWTGQPPTAGSLLTFETHPPLGTTLESELAALGIRVEPVPPPAGHRGFPLALTAHHDAARRLVMTASYSRAPLAAAETLARHTRLLLCELPHRAGESTTVAQVLQLLPNTGTPSGALPAETGSSTHTPAAGPALVVLRRARHPGAGTVALLQAPGRPEVFHDRLAHAYPGPEELVLLAPASGGPPAWATALAAGTRAGTPLVLGALSGQGIVACETARLAAAHGARPRVVILTDDTGDTGDTVRLARSLHTATRHRI
ncbi:condensation domain-containing protein [Streptomyces sp. NBC_01167]|uniref:condensation domain-containing protein n=1 Tax=Streptomyces sp. NBC_01167 TaxID=2903756 RepID=UPI003865AD35|nr:condensation domain-containing protein [Streptomyces sp. NBC_01167]